jgi:hypothetical protein
MTIWSWPGGHLELLPDRGRIAQVVLGGEPAFWAPDQPDGWNVGGDRLWLGPERDWFWASDSRENLDDHVVPQGIDPGRWTAELADRHAVLSAEVGLTHRRTDDVTKVRLRRVIDLLVAEPDRVTYQVTTVVDVVSGRPVSAWSILQVPDGGVLDIALSGPLTYRNYLDPLDPAQISDHGDRAELRLTGERMVKIGLPPDVCAGRLRYSRPVATGVLQVERELDVRPDRHYCDLPVNADGQGDAIQVFDDDGHYGGYAELEHHSPASDSAGHTVDVCRTTVRLLS